MTELQDPVRMRVAVVTPLSEELCELLVAREPRLDVVRDQNLLPPMRWPGDHEGDPSFTRSPDEQARFDELVDSADALYGIPDSDPAALARTVDANPRLRWVHTMAAGGGGQVKAAGLDPSVLERLVVTTSAGPHADTLAEFALLGVLAGAKDLPRLQAQQRDRVWSGRWVMRHLNAMTVVVVGLGSIGKAVAERFAALGTEVIAVNRSQKEVPGVSEVYPPERIAEAMARADAVINTAPGTDRTLNLIGREAFAAAKPGVIVVNVGRGTVIDEQELAAALEDGRVSFAALDVFATEPLPASSPLWAMDNVLVSPHTAALDDAEDRLIAELFADNATALLDGHRPKNVMDTVDFY